VELVGPAGAGKSTLARQCAAADPAVRTDLSLWGLSRLRLFAGAVELLPTAAAAALSARPLGWAELWQMVRIGALWTAVKRARAESGCAVMLLDEGPVFGFTWLRVFGRSETDPVRSRWRERALFRWASILDAVVRVEAPDTVLAWRIRSRAKAHMVKDQTDYGIRRFAACFRRAFERIIGDLAAVRPLPVVALRTDGTPPADSTAELLAAIKGASDVG
jgi:hypothetical protein